MSLQNKSLRIGTVVAVFGIITFAAFSVADSLESGGRLQQVIESSGLFGIVLAALISGLNPFVPIPPATFAPLFIEIGFSTYTIIACFVIGTTLADSIGYVLGWFGRDYTDTAYPALTRRIESFLEAHASFILPIAFVYFAVAPLPNELILIPLALAGYSYKKLLVPIILGNILHHTILVYGYKNVFEMFF